MKDFDGKYFGPKDCGTEPQYPSSGRPRLAIADSKFVITNRNTEGRRLIGDDAGKPQEHREFDEVTLKGPRYVNHALFPNTVINSPASQVNIWNNIKGFSTTLSTGFTSAVGALITPGYDPDLHWAK